uniref:RING-type domain-containing protein n=1 Tax=Chromera velia CCMP2878 TaxID=1169474 RepID=A0A0G4GMM5_9ALVE|eukprot:Cvel_22577.t1-p1 / transcript=Cvel_22577.t1 / gene=Cvel_22577 / organism=Chromera_velia_CCMP2878 / gene_product=hypothetical protein / transcript_product=hypothetical protein / location=Cvel_scaffold2231:29357-30467(-) / protein_length=161 / sequence_SO=supercontig / SO=protein_coding / is_pseudo=false
MTLTPRRKRKDMDDPAQHTTAKREKTRRWGRVDESQRQSAQASQSRAKTPPRWPEKSQEDPQPPPVPPTACDLSEAECAICFEAFDSSSGCAEHRTLCCENRLCEKCVKKIRSQKKAPVFPNPQQRSGTPNKAGPVYGQCPFCRHPLDSDGLLTYEKEPGT